MTEGILIQTLVDQVLAALADRRYADSTVAEYRRFYQRLVRYAEAQGTLYYTDTLGDRYSGPRNSDNTRGST